MIYINGIDLELIKDIASKICMSKKSDELKENCLKLFEELTPHVVWLEEQSENIVQLLNNEEIENCEYTSFLTISQAKTEILTCFSNLVSMVPTSCKVYQNNNNIQLIFKNNDEGMVEIIADKYIFQFDQATKINDDFEEKIVCERTSFANEKDHWVKMELSSVDNNIKKRVH